MLAHEAKCEATVRSRLWNNNDLPGVACISFKI